VTIVARRLRLRRGHRFPRHAHDRWSFGLPTSGSVRLWSAGSWEAAAPGIATVLPPSGVHEGVVDDVRGLEYQTVAVPIDLVAAVLGDERSPGFLGLRLPAGPVVRLLAATRPVEPEERRERTWAAVCAVFGAAGATIPERCERSLAAAAKLLIDTTFTQQIRVVELADRFGVAPATLMRGFRRSHGLSLYAYVLSRRVDMARQLLEAGVAPAVAANRSGFCDQAHLNRHFARLVGVTPGAYRRA
jgi:AraC-like DNA-binding protein